MSADEIHGSGHESEPYVGLLRGISNEVHEHEIRMAQSKGFDEGWLAGIDHAIRMTREETRAQRRAHIERLSRTFGYWKRSARQEVICCAALLLVPAIALWLLKGG